MDSRRHTVNTNSTVPASELRPEDEKLGLGANLAYGLQHVLTMYGGIVAVPLIVAEAAGMSADALKPVDTPVRPYDGDRHDSLV